MPVGDAGRQQGHGGDIALDRDAFDLRAVMLVADSVEDTSTGDIEPTTRTVPSEAAPARSTLAALPSTTFTRTGSPPALVCTVYVPTGSSERR